MRPNVNGVDRLARILIAAIVSYIAFSTTGPLVIALWLVVGIMLGTAAVGSCPLYRMLGISTRKS